MTENKRANFISDLRQLANFYEENINVTLPCLTYIDIWPEVSISEQKLAAQEFARAAGKVEKLVSGSFLILRKKFDCFNLEFNLRRDEVCESHVVGKKMIKTTKVITPAVTQETEEEVDIIEWDCKPIMQEEN